MNYKFLLLIFFGFITACASNTTKSVTTLEDVRKSEKYAAHPEWPLTVDEAIVSVLKELPEADQQVLKSTGKDELIKYHRSLGAAIRNKFGLNQGNLMLLISCDAIKGNIYDADSCSATIIERTWARLNEL